MRSSRGIIGLNAEVTRVCGYFREGGVGRGGAAYFEHGEEVVMWSATSPACQTIVLLRLAEKYTRILEDGIP